MKKQKLPVRSSSQKKEDISKRKFEDLIEPWVVCAWEQKDFGIDATVEIHKVIDNTNDSHPTSKRFLVQLKSTDSIDVDKRQFSYPVDVEKINYWYNSNLPVLFAVFHIPSKQMFYRWINESNELINYFDKKSPGWSLKSKVSIPIETKNILSQGCKEQIEEVVSSWKMASKKIITPGNYFSLKEETIKKIDEVEKIAAYYKFPSIASLLNNLKDLSEQAIYRIAITGPSRVGKSTLINSLLEYEISPVDMFQTTGVPINFLPGREQRIHIMKNGGGVISEKLSEKSIRKYASQQENRDNQKQVKLVSVFLHNKALERGVSFYDIPGLDDPNDEIRNLTWMTAMSSNAVIYMIDASPFRNHGFIFRSDFRKSLTDLGGRLDKVFLVLNKIDDLHPGQLAQLRGKIEEELKRFGLFEKINKRIFYLSAQKKRANLKEKPDSVMELEAEIWEYLLKENKVGLVKIDKVLVETANIVNGFKSLIETRLLDNEQRSKITGMMDAIKKKVPEFSKEVHKDKLLISQTIRAALASRKNNIYEQLLTYLKRIPENNSLPSTSHMKEALRTNINQTIDSTNIDYLSHLTNLKSKFDNWTSANITAVQEAISQNQPPKYVNITNIDRIEFKNIEDMSKSVGMGFFTGALGFLIAPPAALLFGLGGFVMSWFLSKEDRRERAINKIMASCKSKCDEDLSLIENAYNELLEENFKEMIVKANSHLNIYFEDLTNQLQKLDIALPAAELTKMKTSFAEIDKLSEDLRTIKGKIEDSYFSLS